MSEMRVTLARSGPARGEVRDARRALREDLAPVLRAPGVLEDGLVRGAHDVRLRRRRIVEPRSLDSSRAEDALPPVTLRDAEGVARRLKMLTNVSLVS